VATGSNLLSRLKSRFSLSGSTAFSMQFSPTLVPVMEVSPHVLLRTLGVQGVDLSVTPSAVTNIVPTGRVWEILALGFRLADVGAGVSVQGLGVSIDVGQLGVVWSFNPVLTAVFDVGGGWLGPGLFLGPSDSVSVLSKTVAAGADGVLTIVAREYGGGA